MGRLEDLERIGARRAAEVDAEIDQHATRTVDRSAADREVPLDPDNVADERLRAADQVLAAARELVSDRGDQGQDAVRERLDEALEHVYEGDRTAAVEALVDGVAAIVPDARTLADQVEYELAARERVRQLNAGLAAFSTRYPTVAHDVHLAAIADQHLEAALAAGKPIAEAFDSAGRETLNHVRRALGVEESTRRDAAEEDPAGGESASGVIAAMARARPGTDQAR